MADSRPEGRTLGPLGAGRAMAEGVVHQIVNGVVRELDVNAIVGQVDIDDLLTRIDIDALLDPAAYLGLAAQLTDDAVRRALQQGIR